MTRTPQSVWDALAAHRRTDLDEGPARPVADEPTVSHPSRETVGTPLCPSCNGYGWTVSIDGTRPYLNTVVPCPDCQGPGEAA